MKPLAHTSRKLLGFLIIIGCCFLNLSAQDVRTPGSNAVAEKSRSRKSMMDFTRTADFYLRDKTFIFGRLVSQDKNKIVIEQLVDGQAITSTYSKRVIDSRTLDIKTVPEYKYYMDVAEYYKGRIWDFKDDPDEFVQAIQSFEKAKRSLARDEQANSRRIEQIDKKLADLQEDRKLWAKEAESRAKLRKLEYEATVAKKVDEFEKKLNANSRQLDELIQRIDKTITELERNQKELQKAVDEMDKKISRQLIALAARVEANRRDIDRIAHYRFYPYSYYRYRREPNEF